MSRKKNNKHLDLNKNHEGIVSKEKEVLEPVETQVPVVFDSKATQEEIEALHKELEQATADLERTKREIQYNKNLLKAEERRDISEEERQVSHKHVNMSNEKLAKLKALEDQKAYDKVLVTGKFINRRHPGAATKLPYIKYADDPVKWYPLEDGKVYTIPRGFADQINEHYHVPRFIQNTQPMDPNAPRSQISEVDTSNKMYAFTPINF